MTTEIVKQHDVTQIDKLVAKYSKLNQAASAAKWDKLDGAVEKSIAAIDQKFDALAANLIKVRAFLSQQENPGRKNVIEGMVGFPADLTWTTYSQGVARRLGITARTLQGKVEGYELGLPDGQLASSAKRALKKQQKLLEAQTAAATASVEVAKAANSMVEAVDAGFDPAPAIANLENNAISERKLNAIPRAVDVEAKDEAKDAPAPADLIDWKAALAKLLDALDADCMTQHLNKRTKAVISEVEGLVNPVPVAAEEDHAAGEPYDSEHADRIAKIGGLDTNDEIAEKVAVKVKAKRGRKPRTSYPAATPEEIASWPPLWEDEIVHADRGNGDTWCGLVSDDVTTTYDPAESPATCPGCIEAMTAKAKAAAAVDLAEYAANEALLNAHPEWISSTTVGEDSLHLSSPVTSLVDIGTASRMPPANVTLVGPGSFDLDQDVA